MPPPEGLTGTTPAGDTLRVREVWASNLDAELEILRNAVESFPFCAMDTEFPGVVARCALRMVVPDQVPLRRTHGLPVHAAGQHGDDVAT